MFLKTFKVLLGVFFFLFQLGAIQRFESLGEQRKFQLQVGSTPAPSSGLTASWQEPEYQAWLDGKEVLRGSTGWGPEERGGKLEPQLQPALSIYGAALAPPCGHPWLLRGEKQILNTFVEDKTSKSLGNPRERASSSSFPYKRVGDSWQLN